MNELYWIRNSDGEYLYEDEPDYLCWGRPTVKRRATFTKDQAREQMCGQSDWEGILVK